MEADRCRCLVRAAPLLLVKALEALAAPPQPQLARERIAQAVQNMLKWPRVYSGMHVHADDANVGHKLDELVLVPSSASHLLRPQRHEPPRPMRRHPRHLCFSARVWPAPPTAPPRPMRRHPRHSCFSARVWPAPPTAPPRPMQRHPRHSCFSARV